MKSHNCIASKWFVDLLSNFISYLFEVLVYKVAGDELASASQLHDSGSLCGGEAW